MKVYEALGKSVMAFLLRNETWEKVESGDDGITYRVNRGSHVYTIVYDNNEVRLTQPIILNMTKIN